MNSGKNIAASIRQRLLNFAREQKQEFQLILTRFALERFLYRLAQSKHQHDFILKGAMLFQVWGGQTYRPTRDLDLLSFGKPDLVHFASIFAEICTQNVVDDGLIFHTDTIELGRIKEDDEYQGLRATLLVTLESARISLQIDIGFGDVVKPAPVIIDFPTMLDLPIPRLRAYSRETVVAEKFHAMVHLGIANSRMKDFYDLWTLATTYEFDRELLDHAIEATFKRRDTLLPFKAPLAFTDEFAEDVTKMTQWNAFLKKSKLLPPQSVTLKEIVELLSQLIMPLLSGAKDSDSLKMHWDPKSAAWTVSSK